jgi:hypothetical protein
MKNKILSKSEFFLCCDWLQMHVKARPDFMEEESRFYTVKRTGQSRVFGNIYEIRDIVLNKPVATYCTDAREFIMAKNHGVIKVANWVMYSFPNMREWVETFFQRMQMQFIGFTRLDIAFDFQNFDNCEVQNFIHDVMSGKLRKVENKPTKVGTFSKPCDQIGMRYETITWGSRSSAISCKLYNKTEEQKENLKPWIKGQHTNTFKNNKDVWRLEFGITSMNAFLKGSDLKMPKKNDTVFYEVQGTDKDGNETTEQKKGKFIHQIKFTGQAEYLVMNEDGEKIKINHFSGWAMEYDNLEILDLCNLYGMFVGLFEKYFRFKKVDKTKIKIQGIKLRTTRLKDVKLFEFEMTEEKLKIIRKNPLLKQSTRSTKIFLKKMDDFNKEFRLFDENFDYTAKELIGKIIDAHDLHEWAKDKALDYFDKEKQYLKNVDEFLNI